MTKIRKLSHLQDVLDHDIAWRIKELDSLKNLVRKADATSKKTAVRSAICLSCAHWEGFVKKVAKDYLMYVSNQRLRYDELSDPFLAIGVRRHVSAFSSGQTGLDAIEAARFF